MSSILGEFNGRLDRDNLPVNVMTNDKFALGTFHQIKYVSVASDWDYSKEEDQNWKPINGMSTTLTTGDSRLVLKARLSVGSFHASHLTLRATIGVFVDGLLVCVVGEQPSSSALVVGSVAVAAGEHTVDVRFLGAGGRFGARGLMVRECVR